MYEIHYWVYLIHIWDHGQVKHGWRLLEVAKTHKLACVRVYNAFITLCGKAQALDQALKLFDDMRREGIQPRRATWNALLAACQRCAALDEALEVLGWMHRDGFSPPLSALNDVMSAAAKAGDHRLAQEVFEELGQAYGLRADVYSYNILMSAYVKAATKEHSLHQMRLLLHRAWEVFEQLKAARLAPDATTYGTLLSVCGVSGCWERALKWRWLNLQSRPWLSRRWPSGPARWEACSVFSRQS